MVKAMAGRQGSPRPPSHCLSGSKPLIQEHLMGCICSMWCGSGGFHLPAIALNCHCAGAELAAYPGSGIPWNIHAVQIKALSQQCGGAHCSACSSFYTYPHASGAAFARAVAGRTRAAASQGMPLGRYKTPLPPYTLCGCIWSAYLHASLCILGEQVESCPGAAGQALSLLDGMKSLRFALLRMLVSDAVPAQARSPPPRRTSRSRGLGGLGSR